MPVTSVKKSKINRDTKSAVNIDVRIPIDKVTAKP
jgi:hypothetical protein